MPTHHSCLLQTEELTNRTNQRKSVGYITSAYCMRGKQMLVQGCEPSNINLGIFFVTLMFAGLPNQSPLLTMEARSVHYNKKQQEARKY